MESRPDHARCNSLRIKYTMLDACPGQGVQRSVAWCGTIPSGMRASAISDGVAPPCDPGSRRGALTAPHARRRRRLALRAMRRAADAGAGAGADTGVDEDSDADMETRVSIDA